MLGPPESRLVRTRDPSSNFSIDCCVLHQLVAVVSAVVPFYCSTMTSRVAHSRLLLAMLAASCLPVEAKPERLSRGECLACQDECDGRYCPKVCAGKTAEGDDMTCALDTDCLDDSIDPYGGMGCNVRRSSQSSVEI